MKLIMHPNTLQRLKMSQSFLDRIYSFSVGSLLNDMLYYNGHPVHTSHSCPEWEPNIKPLSDDLNISQTVRDKVNATLAKFGQHAVMHMIDDRPTLTYDSFVADMRSKGFM